MARAGRRRRARIAAADAADPAGLAAWMLRYLEALRVRNYSEATLGNREHYLGTFLAWCQARGLTRPGEITRPMLLSYQRHLFAYRKANGDPLSVQSQHSAGVSLRGFFQWLTRENVLLMNPASDLELPKLGHRLPRAVLSEAEVEAVLTQPDLDSALGVRDRAILETFYSTGMRRLELIRLQVQDLDAERGTVLVRQGKGKKDRMLPIGERAVAWTRKYLDAVRPRLVLARDEGTLFLTQQGEPFAPDHLSMLVAGYVDRAELGKRGSCHLLRHSCATAMLEGGADVRFIQELLGHVSLTTTQIYTQVSIQKLKEIHRATHPSARLGPRKAAEPGGPVQPLVPIAPPGAPAAPVPLAEPEGVEGHGPEVPAESDDEPGEWPQKRLWSSKKSG